MTEAFDKKCAPRPEFVGPHIPQHLLCVRAEAQLVPFKHAVLLERCNQVVAHGVGLEVLQASTHMQCQERDLNWSVGITFLTSTQQEGFLSKVQDPYLLRSNSASAACYSHTTLLLCRQCITSQPTMVYAVTRYVRYVLTGTMFRLLTRRLRA